MSRLHILNEDNLVARINENLADKGLEFEKGDFVDTTNTLYSKVTHQIKNIPIIGEGKERVLRGFYPLFLNSEENIDSVFSFMLNMFRSERGPKIGYLEIEKGFVDCDSDYGGTYESIKLRVKHPIDLKRGIVIPNCTLRYSIQSYEREDLKDRSDIVPGFGGIFWHEKNMPDIVPTDWFYYGKSPMTAKPEEVPKDMQKFSKVVSDI